MASSFLFSLYVPLPHPHIFPSSNDTQLGLLGSTIAAVAGSAYSLGQMHKADPHAAPITYSPVWIGILWGGFLCMLFAIVVVHVERNLERFTPRGLPISVRYKPEASGWIWNLRLKRSE
jgi:hypothetical protein